MTLHQPAVVCCYCDPPHELTAGSLPASHGCCERAAAIIHAQLDEEARRRTFIEWLARSDARASAIHAKTANTTR